MPLSSNAGTFFKNRGGSFIHQLFSLNLRLPKMIWLKLPKSYREHKRKPTYVLRSCRKPRWKSAISRLSPLRWNKVVQHVALVLRWCTGSYYAGLKSGLNGCNWTCHVSLNPPSDFTSAVKEKTEKTAAKKRPAAKWLFYRGHCSLYDRLPVRILLGPCPSPLPTRGTVGFLFTFTAQWRLWILSNFGGFETASRKSIDVAGLDEACYFFGTEIFQNRHLLQGGPQLSVIYWGVVRTCHIPPINDPEIYTGVTWMF